MTKRRWEPTIVVVLSCTGDRMPEKNVEFLNIEEDIFGRDVLTFICPLCKEVHKSLRLG